MEFGANLGRTPCHKTTTKTISSEKGPEHMKQTEELENSRLALTSWRLPYTIIRDFVSKPKHQKPTKQNNSHKTKHKSTTKSGENQYVFITMLSNQIPSLTFVFLH